MRVLFFRDAEGNLHNVDLGFNHFINGQCVNPLKEEDLRIGETVPLPEDRHEWIPKLS